MVAMLQQQRMYAYVKFLNMMASIHGDEFESFFHRLMQLRHPGFVPVRTHGNLGDQGADGLSLHDRTLYACYGPQVFNAGEVKDKFRSDLSKAKAKRRGQFDKFTFVHNDRRGGIHPEIATLLRQVADSNTSITFDQVGPQKLWHEIMRLDLVEAEELLGCQIPIEEVVYGIAIDDLAPLLEHLQKVKLEEDHFGRVREAGAKKIEFNRIGYDDQAFLIEGMRYAPLIREYYDGRLDAYAEDQAAAGFASYYQQARDELADDTEEIMWKMQGYVLGNKLARSKEIRAAWAIIAYFFERCHIFETPPPGWNAT